MTTRTHYAALAREVAAEIGARLRAERAARDGMSHVPGVRPHADPVAAGNHDGRIGWDDAPRVNRDDPVAAGMVPPSLGDAICASRGIDPASLPRQHTGGAARTPPPRTPHVNRDDPVAAGMVPPSLDEAIRAHRAGRRATGGEQVRTSDPAVAAMVPPSLDDAIRAQHAARRAGR